MTLLSDGAVFGEYSLGIKDGIKRLQILGAFSQTHKVDGEGVLIFDGDNNATFAGTIEFCNCKAGYIANFAKLSCLK